jgi:hypothetical protein
MPQLLRMPSRVRLATLRIDRRKGGVVRHWLRAQEAEIDRSVPCWPPGEQRATRVLVEHPDAGVRTAQAAVLAEAGYEVQTCSGPAPGYAANTCPLLAWERCGLVEGADVVVTTSGLHHGEEIVAALTTGDMPRVVVEVCRPECERYRALAGDAALVVEPVLSQQLLGAVEGVAPR